MDQNKKRDVGNEAFWDLSREISPKSNGMHTPQKAASAEMNFSHRQDPTPASQPSSVIKRYIDPLHDERKILKKESFESIESYAPSSTLLHSVTLKKRKSAYDLYNDFISFGAKSRKTTPVTSEYAEYYSYVPQFDQLTHEQYNYYVWWRYCFENQKYIRTNQCYVLLYIYELLNIGDVLGVTRSRDLLAEIWNVYSNEFPAISKKLAVWICDFCLLHKLDAPENIDRAITKQVPSLKEFYINIPKGDFEKCVFALLKFGTEYDYHTSKFATEKNIAIFDEYVFGAILTAVKFYSTDGNILSSLMSEDSKLIRNSYEGALCATKWKYELEIKYCSFSRTNELRFIMGDIVKYAENKIRAFLGIKSKLSVYSINDNLQKALDSYFENTLLTKAPPTKPKSIERHDYDKLYDLPQRTLSLDNAKKIEMESWDTTNELITAFDISDTNNDPIIVPIGIDKLTISDNSDNKEEKSYDTGADPTLKQSLGEYYAFALAIKEQRHSDIINISKDLDMLPEAIIDIINEISLDIVGDIIIEDGDNGPMVIDCYQDML